MDSGKQEVGNLKELMEKAFELEPDLRRLGDAHLVLWTEESLISSILLTLAGLPCNKRNQLKVLVCALTMADYARGVLEENALPACKKSIEKASDEELLAIADAHRTVMEALKAAKQVFGRISYYIKVATGE